MLLSLTGCFSTNSQLLKPDQADSLIEFTKELRDRTSAGLDSVMVKIGNESVDKDYLKAYKTWWCPRHTKVNSTADVEKQYEQYCEHKGGRFEKPYCINVNNPDDVLFIAQIRNSRKCTGGYSTADVMIVEPIGDRTSRGYVAALKKYGFKTQKEREAERRRNEFKYAQATNAVKRRQERDAPFMKVIGTKICKDDIKNLAYTTTYIGYIERVEAKNIQIRITDAIVNNNPRMHPGGFRSSVIWDSPLNWYVCR